MLKTICASAVLALVAIPVVAQNVVSGDATAGLVSKTAKAEVHLIADAALNDKRLVLKVVILNLSGTAQPFGPDAITVTAGDAPIALATRDALLAGQTGAGATSDETSQARAAAAMPTNGAGQTDVSGFTGGMGGVTAGVPQSAIDRSQRRPNAAAALDAVLLKPMTVRANGADGGQVLTEKLKRAKVPEVVVAVAFAGEVHRFAVKVPR
jgi:hypothetical protein